MKNQVENLELVGRGVKVLLMSSSGTDFKPLSLNVNYNLIRVSAVDLEGFNSSDSLYSCISTNEALATSNKP